MLHGPEAAVVPVVEARPAEREVSRGADPRARRDLLVRQGAGAGDELVGRSGRVVRLGRMVEERLVGVVEQLRVVLDADAAGELVVVVGRETDEREDLARLRVHRDDHAALDPDLLHRPLECLLGVPLLLGVDRERQRVARLGLRERLEDLGLLARGVLLDTLRAVDAPQAALVLRFDADLADQVVGEVAVLFQVEELLAARPDPCSRGAATSAAHPRTTVSPRPRPRLPGARTRPPR